MSSRPLILIVDDNEMNRDLLSDILGDEYDTIEAKDGVEALEILDRRSAYISVMLLDITMPKLDGFGVLEAMNERHIIEDLPVIMISAENGTSFVRRAYALGATDYINRPFDMDVVLRRVRNTYMLYSKQKNLKSMAANELFDSVRQSSMMINILGHAVEFRNGESKNHVANIGVLTYLILKHIKSREEGANLTTEDIFNITNASALHDIGKIVIPEGILNKPGRFTDEEFAIMKRHTTYGSEILDSVPTWKDEPLMKTAWEIARWHHERWDGRGYPDGLSGDEIPLAAQIVALADVYDALTSERCYKKAFTHDVAIEMITTGKCGTFNPLILDCLREIAPILADKARMEVEREEMMVNITRDMMESKGLKLEALDDGHAKIFGGGYVSSQSPNDQ